MAPAAKASRSPVMFGAAVRQLRLNAVAVVTARFVRDPNQELFALASPHYESQIGELVVVLGGSSVGD